MHEIAFDAAAVRGAFREAADGFVAVTRAIPEPAWSAPGLGVWTVRDLAGHTGRAFLTVTGYLREGADRAVTVAHPFDYFDVLVSGYADHDAVAERGRKAGAELGDDPAVWVAARRDEVLAAVDGAPDDAPVATPMGVMRLVDYLPSRVLELTVHTADVAAATGVSFAPGRAAVGVTLAALAHLAAVRPDAVDVARALAGRGVLPHSYSVF